jgi:integrase
MSTQPTLASFAQLAAQFQVVRVSTSCWLRESKANARGLAPISLRITVDGTRIERSTGLRTLAPVRDEAGCIVTPGGWDEQSGCLRGKGKLVTMQNEQLELLKAHVRDLVNLMKATGRRVTASTLRKQLIAPTLGQPLDFFELCQQQITSFYSTGSQATLQQKQGALAVLADWHGRTAQGQPRPLLLEDFTPDQAKQFYDWLLSERGVKVSTANSHVGNLTTLFMCAVRLGEADLVQNPFRLLQKKTKQASARTRLSLAQIAQLREAELGGEQTVARDIYLAQYYLHGSRVGAVLKLRWQDITSEGVRFRAEKGGPLKNVALSPELRRVLARYQPATPAPTALIFPLLPASFFSLGAPAQFQARKRAIMALNRALRRVAVALGLPEGLHSHTARHTLALHAATAGGMRVAQKMLGHARLSQTEVYVGELPDEQLRATEQALYGQEPPQAPAPEGGRVVPLWEGGQAA